MIIGERDIRSDSDVEDRRTWAIWGNRTEILDGLAETLTSHGGCPLRRVRGRE